MQIAVRPGIVAPIVVARRLSLALRTLLSVLIWALPVPAQDGVSVTGSVRETGGNALGGAKVTLVNQETQAKEETVTNEAGTFTFTQVRRDIIGAKAKL